MHNRRRIVREKQFEDFNLKYKKYKFNERARIK